MICILGCLLTEAGIQIKSEMLSHFKEHTIFCVEQEPPGKYAEYPALYYTIKAALDFKRPILYCHTKGAGNPIPYHCTRHKGSFADVKPQGASLADWQPSVRNMWYHEFTGLRLQEYLTVASANRPIVACPYSGKGNVTWQNGFIINYHAALELNKIFHQASNRYWYEIMFSELPNVEVHGMIYNHINYPLDESRFDMYKSIWSFYHNSVKKT